jgi:hypothetical protein
MIPFSIVIARPSWSSSGKLPPRTSIVKTLRLQPRLGAHDKGFSQQAPRQGGRGFCGTRDIRYPGGFGALPNLSTHDLDAVRRSQSNACGIVGYRW